MKFTFLIKIHQESAATLAAAVTVATNVVEA